LSFLIARIRHEGGFDFRGGGERGKNRQGEKEEEVSHVDAILEHS